MRRALALMTLLAAAPSTASAQELGRQLDRPLPRRPTTPAPRAATLPDPVYSEPASDEASPWLALSVTSYALAAVSLGVLIGGQVRLTDIGNDPYWMASRERFGMAEDICAVETEPTTVGLCDEAAALQPLVSVSAVMAGLGAVLGTVFLVLEL